MGILLKIARKPKSKKIQVGLPPNERYCFTPLDRHNAKDLSVVICSLCHFSKGLFKSGRLFLLPKFSRKKTILRSKISNHLLQRVIKVFKRLILPLRCLRGSLYFCNSTICLCKSPSFSKNWTTSGVKENPFFCGGTPKIPSNIS